MVENLQWHVASEENQFIGGFVVDAATDLADDGLFCLSVDLTGSIVSCNPALASAVGLPIESLTSLSLWDLMDRDSAQQLLDRGLKLGIDKRNCTVRLQLTPSADRIVRLVAHMSTRRGNGGSPVLCLTGFDDTENFRHLSKLEYATEMLNGFTDASTEAMWCIEYTEAVDLTLGEQEIIRQVFENECHWSMCNRAMAAIYNLPADLDFNRQRVSLYFRRNPTNEAFVRQLIDSRFHIDSAPSVDVRHDGSMAYIENSVRCHIEDGKMVRMWGTVRDTTEFRVAHNRLAQREREVRDVLSAIPDAVLVINKAQQVLAVNPAFESSFGWRADTVLGKSASTIVNLESNGADDHRWFGLAERRWSADVTKMDGASVACEIRMAPFPDDELSRYVLCLRPAKPATEALSTSRLSRGRRARSRARLR